MAAVDWPDLDELKAVLDVSGDDWNDHLSGLMTAAIEKVKGDVGSWDESLDSPDARLAKAALRAAAIMQVNAGSPEAVDLDPVYTGYLKGHRRVFGFA
jgi:folate-binding Fe-S cluster repair protein YgfZ